MSLGVILWIILGYLAFRFIFRFLLPLFVVSRKMKQQVKQFHNAMNAAQQQQQAAQSSYSAAASASTTKRNDSPKEKSGDYIDFEEVK